MIQQKILEDTRDDKPSRKKPIYPINEGLRQYLRHYGREQKLPVHYRDLERITYSVPLKDKKGKDTLWETCIYDMRDWDFIREGLLNIYAVLKTEGDVRFMKHLDVARIDYCGFGNSNPFRIRIVNKFNDNYDHYYIKQADASRIYGLELEHILSPNRITYFTHAQTLVEEHIPGVPGDMFIANQLDLPETNKVRFLKEFVKFNERCFVRLLGDMRSYNFVVDITPDIEDYQYRIRAIDFDQQSYEGRKNLYLPQFYKENYRLVELSTKLLNRDSVEQYRKEERTMMAYRLIAGRYRIMELLNQMSRDTIAPPEKLEALKRELAEHFDNPDYLKCRSMGQLVKTHMKQTMLRNLRMVQQQAGKYGD